jgi:uracil-DNA glycosylase
MDAHEITLENSWKDVLHDEFQEPYMAELCSFLRGEYALGKQIYPPKAEIFERSISRLLRG